MLKLSPSCYTALRRHGEETYPYECCGVLLGRFEEDIRVVTSVVPCGNTRDDSPHNRYNIDPRDLVRIQAHWIGCSYVITSVEKGKSQLTNSFSLAGESEENKRFEDEGVEVG
jgi:hypothetical protein